MTSEKWRVAKHGWGVVFDDDAEIVRANGYERTLCTVNVSCMGPEKARKASLLIAAVPDLLAAAQAAFDHLKAEQISKGSGQFDDVLNELLAALKKAKGH